MAKKPVVTNLEDLRRWFENSAQQFESSAWNLYAGFKESLAERNGMLTKQPDPNKSVEDSFEWLQDAIEMASFNGGEFTIYMPNPKHSVHGYKVFFSVAQRGDVQGVGLGGFPSNPAAMGYITREEFNLQQQMWQLRRENEDLKAAIENPPTFLAGIAQQAVENGTVERLLSGIMGLLEKAVTGFAIKQGAYPTISVNGIEGQPVNPMIPTMNNQPEEEQDYPEAMYDFADYIFKAIGNDPAIQAKFWTNLKAVAIQQPSLIQQLIA